MDAWLCKASALHALGRHDEAHLLLVLVIVRVQSPHARYPYP